MNEQEKVPFYKKNWFIILTLIVFFPIGLVLMWMFSSWGRTPKIIVTAVIALFAVIGSTGDTEESTAEEESNDMAQNEETTEEVTEEETEEPTEEQTEEETTEEPTEAETTEESTEEETTEEPTEEQTEEVTEEETTEEPTEEEAEEETSPAEEVKETANEVVEDVIQSDDEIEEIGYVEEGEQLLIRINTGIGWSNESMKNTMYVQTHDILEKLEEINNVDIINIGFNLPLQDEYGNEEDREVMTLVFNGETRNKINYGNILHEKLADVADDYWEHPALNK
ncbi:hypothetical protein [Salinicoccus albus]|uniref:hypothetical protein n=1 Tax=Salinicoccus albus TaxID=418756 RepID=UPI00036CBB95|nr:hypothetical protein [Salinicoccus albus]